MAVFLDNMVNCFMDIIFPQYACCICREPGRYATNKPWCTKCEKNMQLLRQNYPICDKCGKYLEKETDLCTDCRNNPPEFSIARAVGPYEEPYRIAIKVLKFLGRKKLAVKMGCMMAETVLLEPRFWPLDLIISVPASKGSLNQQGFNQTEVLGLQISKILQLKMDCTVLRRVKETPSQRELSRLEREKNLLCAFQVSDKKRILGKKILLVDDIYTTGSTSRECTRTLLNAGAEKVSIITWATGKGF